ncbi:hypothetical protein SPFM20_00007 [Salmonella phage SPFM20]|nr:hypothetical protein SPFM20_00007 [Salmonella phage SPFM20]
MMNYERKHAWQEKLRHGTKPLKIYGYMLSY